MKHQPIVQQTLGPTDGLSGIVVCECTHSLCKHKPEEDIGRLNRPSPYSILFDKRL